MASSRTARPVLCAHPVDVVQGWVEATGPYLVVGWLVAVALWWGVTRHSEPALGHPLFLVASWVLAGGLVVAYLLRSSLRYIRTANPLLGVDCLCLFVLFLGSSSELILVYIMGISLVYLGLRGIAGSMHGNKAILEASLVARRSESYKKASRPCEARGILTFRAAASYDGFGDVQTKFGRWLARRGMIASWNRRGDSFCYLLGETPTFPWAKVGDDRHASWVRVDQAGRCSVFISPRDLRRLGGRPYEQACRRITNYFSEAFLEFIQEKAKPGGHR